MAVRLTRWTVNLGSNDKGFEKATPLTEKLLAMKSIFLSRMVYQTYNGYVLS